MNAIVAAVNAGEIMSGVGVRVAKTPGGTTISSIVNRQLPDQPPPFWPKIYPGASNTHALSVERGTVIGRITSAGASPENREYWVPSNLITDGKPTLFSITAGQSLYCVVSANADGSIAAVILGVYAEGSPPSGTYGGHNTVYSFKLCTVESDLSVSRWWSGNNIDLCGRNLNLKVHVVTINSVTHFITEISWHTLVWRFGDYIGKFASSDTLPPYIGTMDTDDITYIGSST